MAYVRFQSTDPTPDGRHPGFLGLINNLSKAGQLTPAEEDFRRTTHSWYEVQHTNPTTVDATVYDHTINPGATAWFKDSATPLITRAEGYLQILEAHGVHCTKVLVPHPPGRIIYEDADQIVVVPSAEPGPPGNPRRPGSSHAARSA